MALATVVAGAACAVPEPYLSVGNECTNPPCSFVSVASAGCFSPWASSWIATGSLAPPTLPELEWSPALPDSSLDIAIWYRPAAVTLRTAAAGGPVVVEASCWDGAGNRTTETTEWDSRIGPTDDDGWRLVTASLDCEQRRDSGQVSVSVSGEPVATSICGGDWNMAGGEWCSFAMEKRPQPGLHDRTCTAVDVRPSGDGQGVSEDRWSASH